MYAIDADYFFASDAITNQFAKEYYLGGFINNEMKDEVSKNLFRSNTIGSEFNTSITVAQKLDTLFGLRNGTSFIRLSNRGHQDGKFEDDLFEIYFRGNKNYAGKTADLGPFHFESFIYQQFEYGIEQNYSAKDKSITWSASLALNIGQKYSYFDSPGTTLYTAADGSYFDVDFHLKIRQNDSSQSSFGSFNGFGLSGAGYLIIKDKTQNTWSFSADNLGFISWTKESSEIPIDSTFRFTGIDVTDLLDFSDTIHTEITSDSAYVQAFLTERSKKAFTSMLPFHLRASYTAQLKPEKLSILIGAEHILFSGATLRGFAEMKYNLAKKHQVAFNLSYGGYTFWNIGLSYRAIIGKSWIFNVGSDYLSAMIKQNGLAQGAFVSLQKYF